MPDPLHPLPVFRVTGGAAPGGMPVQAAMRPSTQSGRSRRDGPAEPPMPAAARAAYWMQENGDA
jgi:hypothetical protein